MRALVVVIALAATAYAQPPGTQWYRVRPNDTLDLIAAEFYGDRGQATLIIAENKLKDRKLKGGERLRIPVTRVITTDKGDTFETLAQTYLGDAKRGPVLAEFNEQSAQDIPATGTAVNIPAQIVHVAQDNETLAHIATQYFGDAKGSELLRRYNFLDRGSIAKGESVLVPLLNLHIRSVKLPAIDAEAKSRREEHHRVELEAQTALPFARTAWLQGDFAGVKGTLGPFAARLEYLDTPTAVEVGLLLGKALVAFDDTAEAVRSFSHVLARKPKHVLHAYFESPKVIDAWKQAGGQLRI